MTDIEKANRIIAYNDCENILHGELIFSGYLDNKYNDKSYQYICLVLNEENINSETGDTYTTNHIYYKTIW